METFLLNHSYIWDAIGLITVILLTYILFLRRDLGNLSAYLEDVKHRLSDSLKKIKTLEMEQLNNPVQELLLQTLEHIKKEYEQTFGHEIGKQLAQENKQGLHNTQQQLLYIMAYQQLSVTLAALENTRTPEKTWDKINTQLEHIIKQFLSLPQHHQQMSETAAQQEQNDTIQKTGHHATSSPGNDNTSNKSQADSQRDAFILERKNEIGRLKSQIANQFEEIWKLQSELSGQLEHTDNDALKEFSNNFELISRQLKDAQLCIDMMEADIATADEEIAILRDDLAQCQKQSGNNTQKPAPTHNALSEQIRKKDDLIARLTREQKEMLTLFDGMEKNAMEQAARIRELEEQLTAKKSN